MSLAQVEFLLIFALSLLGASLVSLYFLRITISRVSSWPALARFTRLFLYESRRRQSRRQLSAQSHEASSESVEQEDTAQTEQQNSKVDELHRERHIPVRYASDRASSSLWRVIPWEARGTIEETSDGYHFEGHSSSGEDLDLSFKADSSTINYQKGNLLWDGGLSWCVIEANGEKHYFTSDVDIDSPTTKTGAGLDDMQDGSTQELYRQLTERYLRRN